MSEAAPRTDAPQAPVPEPAFPRLGPRFAPGWCKASLGDDAARVLFGEGATQPGAEAGGDEAGGGETGGDRTGAFSQLRHQVRLQGAQLERAMEEIADLSRRLEQLRARARGAEAAVVRERDLRGRQGAAAARRLREHEQTIAELSARIRFEREAHSFREAESARPGPGEVMQRELAARARVDAQVGDVIATARVAIAQAREALSGAAEREACLTRALRREQMRTAALQRALGGAGPRVPDLSAVCQRLEQELATRQALELRAAQLIGRLQSQLGAAG
jgi:chromosome segregation ATPase